MKRAIVVLVCVSVVGAALFGLVKAAPFVRDAIEMNRHASQASRREPIARAEWKAEFGDPAESLAAFRSHEDSEAAVRLTELARSVGIDLKRPKSEQPHSLGSGADRALSQAISEYGRSELTRPSGSVQSPPTGVQAFLELRRGEISEIVDFLSTSQSLAWKTNVSLGSEAPIPNLVGQIRLQRLLVAEALSRAHLGQQGNAERVFRASWNLNVSLRDRPDVVSQLIAIAVARLQVGLARRLLIDPASWRNRLVDHDYRRSLLRAMEAESIAGLRHLPSGSSRWDRASRADFLDMRRSFLLSLRDSPVSDRQDKSHQRDETPRSAGAIIAMITLTNLADAVRRADRLVIDTELTERILEVRMQKAALGHWPSALPSNLEVSRMPGERWVYFVGTDGRMTIHFSRELTWENQQGLILPTRYDSS
jgi:hypothetical protein